MSYHRRLAKVTSAGHKRFLFVLVYVNHRPVFGLSSKELTDSFATLGRQTKEGTVFIQRDALISVLQKKGKS